MSQAGFQGGGQGSLQFEADFPLNTHGIKLPQCQGAQNLESSQADFKKPAKLTVQNARDQQRLLLANRFSIGGAMDDQSGDRRRRMMRFGKQGRKV